MMQLNNEIKLNDDVDRALNGAIHKMYKVFAFGESKHPDADFMMYDDRHHLLAALHHIENHFDGEYRDEESGEPNLAHALDRIACAIACYEHKK